MKLDANTECPACPVIVRNLYATARVLLAHLMVEEGTALGEAAANLEIAVSHLTPFVEAHLENQEHSMSTFLQDARNPTRPGALVDARVLPFPVPGESE